MSDSLIYWQQIKWTAWLEVNQLDSNNHATCTVRHMVRHNMGWFRQTTALKASIHLWNSQCSMECTALSAALICPHTNVLQIYIMLYTSSHHLAKQYTRWPPHIVNASPATASVRNVIVAYSWLQLQFTSLLETLRWFHSTKQKYKATSCSVSRWKSSIFLLSLKWAHLFSSERKCLC